MDVKGDSGELRRAVERTVIFLEEAKIMYRILIEIWMLKTILMRPQLEVMTISCGGEVATPVYLQGMTSN